MRAAPSGVDVSMISVLGGHTLRIASALCLAVTVPSWMISGPSITFSGRAVISTPPLRIKAHRRECAARP
jgi:hypothetical protein